jgi:hypothetical protein
VKYVSHARTLEELKAEFVSDIRRRIATIDGYANAVSKNAAEKARLATATREFQAMFDYWVEVEVRHKRKRQEDISGSHPLPHISNAETKQ